MRWELIPADWSSLQAGKTILQEHSRGQAEKTILQEHSRGQAEEMAMAWGSQVLEDMDKAGMAALEMAGAEEDKQMYHFFMKKQKNRKWR